MRVHRSISAIHGQQLLSKRLICLLSAQSAAAAAASAVVGVAVAAAAVAAEAAAVAATNIGQGWGVASVYDVAG